ncbi:MAG: hypothetical protein QOC63_1983 [Mycobacterium sp.]|jgi:hypothetical protein|nr:hypothetical protein [Mycobacterium sp.]
MQLVAIAGREYDENAGIIREDHGTATTGGRG